MPTTSNTPLPPAKSAPEARWPLAIAGGAALLASTCCALPLLLVLLGISGAWMIHLRVMQPFYSPLIIVSVAALGFSWSRVFRSNTACSIASRQVSRALFVIIGLLTLGLLATPLLAPYFY